MLEAWVKKLLDSSHIIFFKNPYAKDYLINLVLNNFQGNPRKIKHFIRTLTFQLEAISEKISRLSDPNSEDGKNLAKVKEFYAPDAAGGIIMDPKTGEIVALAALPTFDPGEKIPSLDILKNPLVENVYEMGSIFKPLTLGAALDAGVIEPTTTYND